MAEINMPFYVVSGGISILLKSILDSVIDVNEYPNFFMFSNEGHFNNETNVLTKVDMLVNSSQKQDLLCKSEFSFF